MLELVDNPDLGSGGASRGGSSPPTRTRERARPFGRVFAFGYGGTPSVHRYPTPKSPPSGRGLGGRSRRSPDGSVASLRSIFDSVLMQCQCLYFSPECAYRSTFWTLTSIFSRFCLHRSTFWTCTSTIFLDMWRNVGIFTLKRQDLENSKRHEKEEKQAETKEALLRLSTGTAVRGAVCCLFCSELSSKPPFTYGAAGRVESILGCFPEHIDITELLSCIVLYSLKSF